MSPDVVFVKWAFSRPRKSDIRENLLPDVVQNRWVWQIAGHGSQFAQGLLRPFLVSVMNDMISIEDFPAAHSMDSGWFAVDSEGLLAHFDTGEGGAMPNDVAYATGEAGSGADDEDKIERLWLVHILPWVARNLETGHLPGLGDVYALFDTAAHAEQARAHGAENVPENELLVAVIRTDDSKYATAFEGLEGFVGFAPTLDEVYCNPEQYEIFPVVRYGHGDWEIPGHYVREHVPKIPFKAPAEMLQELVPMKVSFAEAEEIQLADHYTDDECSSWSMADLRTGGMQDEERSDGNTDGFWAKLRRFFS